MKTASAKAKGRNLCKYVKERILTYFSSISQDDIKVTSSGATGEDLQLSPLARRWLPISIECKNRKAIAIYKDYEQCKSNSYAYEPILIIKQNNSKPLAIMDLEYFLQLQLNSANYTKSYV